MEFSDYLTFAISTYLTVHKLNNMQFCSGSIIYAISGYDDTRCDKRPVAIIPNRGRILRLPAGSCNDLLLCYLVSFASCYF